MSPEMILAILDGITDPRNQGKLTRMDYVNAQSALNALQKHFSELEKPKVAPVDPAKSE
jgi:hypothetical protein